MGSWGHGVLQGDTPLDILYDIGEALGEGDLYPMEFSEERNTMIALKLETMQGEIMERLLAMPGLESREALPVLAALVMATGAPMIEALRNAAAQAADENALLAEAEGWDSPKKRVMAMTDFASLIRAYQTGQRVPIQQMNKGLFEVLADGLNETIH